MRAKCPGRVRFHVYVSGRVQGVFFRANTKKQALKLGVKGWVRNLPDGRVEAVFEGSKDAVAGIVAWALYGPPAARVDKLEATREEPECIEGFEIRY